jgi:hypothetical protein
VIPPRTSALAGLLAASGLAAGCGAPEATTATQTGSRATPAASGSTSTAVLSTSATSATGATPRSSPAPLACSGVPVEGTVAGATGQARVLDVSAASHEGDGFDRFVIHLSAVPASYRVIPQGTPDFFEDASGRPVTLMGTAGVHVTLQGVAGTPVYAGPSDLRPGLAQLREARQLGSFEGVVNWGLGLTKNGCVRVIAPTAAAPTLVVDIATG